MSKRRYITAIALFILCSSSFVSACSGKSLLIRTTPSFVLNVLDFRNRPLGGATFLLSRDKTIQTFAANSKGDIAFKAVPSGDYTLTRTDETTPSFAVTIRVDEGQAPEAKPIVIRWPEPNVHTRRLAGTLHFYLVEPQPMPTPSDDVPVIETARIEKGTLSKMHLDLFRARTEKKVAQTITSEDGAFSFPHTKAGLYELRFQFKGHAGSKLVELDSDSRSLDHLDLWFNNQAVLNGFVSVIRGCED